MGLYERMGERTTQPFALQVLDDLGTLKGLSLIDVAAGTGGLALEAAERGARVLASDISPAMIERTQERLRPFEDCAAVVMDFNQLTADDGSFDVAVSIFGVLAYPTWRQGLAEMTRVTRADGRIVMAMWTHRDDCSPAHLMRRAFQSLFPGRELWPSDLFPLFTEETLEAAVRDAGCTDVTVGVATADWSPYSSADVVDECDPMFRSFPGYAALDDDESKELRAALQDAFDEYAGDDGTIRLPTKAFVATGRVQ